MIWPLLCAGLALALLLAVAWRLRLPRPDSALVRSALSLSRRQRATGPDEHATHLFIG